MEARYNSRPTLTNPTPSYPSAHPRISATCDITVVVRKVAQNPTILAT